MLCRKYALISVALLWPMTVAAQITPTYTFSSGQIISSSQMNTNFALMSNALNRTGGNITGNITVSNGITIDGVDLSAWLDQSVKIAATPTFAGLTISGTGASALDVAGGINAGSGNVGIVGTDGRIPAISSTYFASLSGTNLTGVALLGSTNTFTNRNDFKLYSETKTSPSISGGALTIDLSAGTAFAVSLNANATITISNPVPTGQHGSFMIRFTADGTLRTLTWPAAVKWVQNVTPTMSQTNGVRDIVTCVYDDAGTTYFCAIAQNFPS